MSTSANVIEYTIYHNGVRVGHISKNVLCRLPHFSDLLVYEPLAEHTILPWGYDEEEDEWEGEERNLEEFLKANKLFDKKLREYFKDK